MKKILSVVLALVMMFAVCVPAFAATELKGNKANDWQNAGDVIIKTQTVDDHGDPITPEEFANFTVTIPADTTINWGTETTDVGYTVESHLLRNQQLKVVVAGTDSMKTDPANGKVYNIAYDLDGTTEYLANTQVVYPAASVALNVVIPTETWNKAVVETYTDTLTYTASVIPFVEA